MQIACFYITEFCIFPPRSALTYLVLFSVKPLLLAVISFNNINRLFHKMDSVCVLRMSKTLTVYM